MERICVLGSINMDHTVRVPHLPRAGETLLAESLELVPGGKGANQAYAAGKLGGRVVMLGAVGEDGAGRVLLESLGSAGVDVSRVKRAHGEPTGAAFISVDSAGENSIVVAPGANRLVDIPYVEENLDVLRSCGVLVLQLEIPLETVVFAAKKAKEMGKLVILDPAPARMDLPEQLYACVDLLKPNEGEAALLGGTSPEEPVLAAARLRERGVKNVVVTLGGEGAYLLDSRGKGSRFPAEQGIPVADTTAAGDCFTAAMARCLAAGWEMERALEFAGKAAALSVSRKGAQPSIPSLEEVNALYP